MKIVISPAKTLDFSTELPTSEYSLPRFLEETEKLNKVLKKKSPKKLQSLMDISAALAVLNHERNLNRVSEYSLENARQAIYAFKGDVYLGLDAYSLEQEKMAVLNQKLRILSGLYGILRPLDLIQPYRLEMGTSLKIGKNDNLYQFWGKKITNSINEELEADEPLINLASQEYFGAVKPALIKSKVITPIFKDFVNGKYKIISFNAKRARGIMTRFAVDKEIDKADDLKHFNYGDYSFDDKQSDELNWVFIR